MIDSTHIDMFRGELKEILLQELAAGNEVQGTWTNWPYNCLTIALKEPFITPIQNDNEDIVFRNVDDVQYWKADYYDQKRKQMLICNFGAMAHVGEM